MECKDCKSTACFECGKCKCAEWIKCSEILPEIGVSVLSTDGELIATTSMNYNDYTKEYYWSYFSSGCGCCDTDMKNVTHWMPLPSPPKD
jgi:hypothetical protein